MACRKKENRQLTGYNARSKGKRTKRPSWDELPPPVIREAEGDCRVTRVGYDLSATHMVLFLSYLYPGAVFRASLVVFMVNHHLLSFIVG
jgi:hypothetical protein